MGQLIQVAVARDAGAANSTAKLYIKILAKLHAVPVSDAVDGQALQYSNTRGPDGTTHHVYVLF